MTGSLPPAPPRLRRAAAALLLLLGAGCGGRTLVVLAPDPGGGTGAVTVSGAGGSVAMAAPDMATRVGGGTGAPSTPSRMDRAAIDALFGDALSVQPTAPAHYLLHFEKDLLLDAESSALLQAILADIREHGSKDVSVVGHTDTVGSAEYNLALSRRRADFVREFLVRGGVDPAFVRSSSHGKENPLVRTGDNVSERRNRRVEVVVR